MKTIQLTQRSISLLLSSIMTCGLLFAQTPYNPIGEEPVNTEFQTPAADLDYAGQSMLVEPDSLSLAILRVEIQKAEVAAAQTDFLHRLIPQVHLSASYGLKDIMFIDPSSRIPYILPRDSYRLTVSLSLTDILRTDRRELALCQLSRMKTMYQLQEQRQEDLHSARGRKLALLQEDRKLLDQERDLVQKVLDYHEMLFEQGRLHFDAVVKSRLQLLSVKRNIQRLSQQIEELQLALRDYPD